MQRLPGSRIELDRRNPAPLQHVAQVVQRLHEIAHGPRRVRLQIGTADDSLARRQVDQDQWPFGDRGDARDDRPLQLQQHRPRANAFERKRRCGHVRARG